MSVIDVPLPIFDDLRDLLREIVQVVRAGKRAIVELTSPRLVRDLARR